MTLSPQHHRSFRFTLLVALTLMWSGIPLPASAASVVFVRPDGDDWQCDGSIDAPYPGGTGPFACAFQTVWKGQSVVDASGTVFVGPGTYTVGFAISKSVNVVGSGVDVTIVDMGGSPWGIIVSYNPGDPVPTVTVSGVTVENATAAGDGAGVLNWGGHFTLSDCAIRNNTAAAGAGVYNSTGGVMTIRHCVIEGNVATGGGGGGVFNQGSLFIEDTAIQDNHAEAESGRGGGILNANTAPDEMGLTRVSLNGNTAETFGSAIHDQGTGNVTLTNCTVSDNTLLAAYGPGDGTLVSGASSFLRIAFSTIAGNLAPVAGAEGGIYTAGPVQISDSIVANNDHAQCLVSGAGSITSNGHNIDSGTTCGFHSTGDMENTDPDLGPLADNGGPSPTMALLRGSPAVDAASAYDCSMKAIDDMDQRGVTRPIGVACDIGAYEAELNVFLPAIMR